MVNGEFIGSAAIIGDEGTGKTSMALGFAKPMFHMDIDVGSFDRASWRLSPDMKIYRVKPSEKLAGIDVSKYDIVTKSYPKAMQIEQMQGAQVTVSGSSISVRVNKRIEGMRELWQEMISDLAYFCMQPPTKSIILDAGTMFYRVAHQGLLQEKQEIQIAHGIQPDSNGFRERLLPIEYAPAYERIRQVYHTCKAFRKNLISTHYFADVYGQVPDGKGGYEQGKTGERKLDGFVETEQLADLVVQLRLVDGKNKDGSTYKYPVAKITKCALAGMGITAVGMESVATLDGILSLRAVINAINKVGGR